MAAGTTGFYRRGDVRARAKFYNWMRQNGIMNADEIRELENMNPQEGECGKAYLVNGNMISAETAAKQNFMYSLGK